MTAKDLRVVPGKVFGYHLETDDFVMGGFGGEEAYDLLLGTSGLDSRIVRYSINTHKYRDAIYTAVRMVNLINLQVDRITILKGVVQAHPPTVVHWRCPFCYPNNEPERVRGIPHDAVAFDEVQDLLKEKFCAGHRGDKPEQIRGRMNLTTGLDEVQDLLEKTFCSCKEPLPLTEWYNAFGDRGHRVCSSCGFRRDTRTEG